MDETEIKKAYFVLISEARPEKREEAFKKLRSSDDLYVRDLAGIGKSISLVLRGVAEPANLDNVLSYFDRVPMANHWYGLIEASGQIILTSALSTREQDRAKQLFRYGLKMIDRALGGTIPVNETTVELICNIGCDDAEIMRLANSLVKKNTALVPERKSFRSPRTSDEHLFSVKPRVKRTRAANG